MVGISKLEYLVVKSFFNLEDDEDLKKLTQFARNVLPNLKKITFKTRKVISEYAGTFDSDEENF